MLNGEFLFAFFCFVLVSWCVFPLCSPLRIQGSLPLPASPDLHSIIGSNVGIFMLLPHSDVGDITETVTWPTAWFGS